MEDNIYTQIEELESSFIENGVEIVSGYKFNQLNTIKRIHLYYNSKFESGSSDDQGEKYFYNILKAPCKNSSKNIDFDTKDLLVVSDDGRYYRDAFLLRRELDKFLKTRKLGKDINELVRQMPKYGSVVVKKVSNDRIFEVVDLRNLRNDQTAKNLKDSWISEIHLYTPDELKRMKGWDKKKIDKAVKSFFVNKTENYTDKTQPENKGGAKYIKVREYIDWIPKKWLAGGQSTDYVKGKFVVILPEEKHKKQTNSEGKIANDGLILYKEELSDIRKDFPYKECHYDRTEGRWLGIGLVEDGFTIQQMKNEQMNQIILAMKLANLVLYATNDENFHDNILTDVLNGDVLSLKQQLTRIPTEIRNVGANQQMTNEIQQLSTQLFNSFEVTTGESLPSGTPLGLGAMMNQNANKLFDFIREELGIFLEEIFEDWILPELSKELNTEHILELTNKEEFDWLIQDFKKKVIWDAVKEMILDTGKKPSGTEVDMAGALIEERFASKDSVYQKIPKGYYKDAWKHCKVVFSAERLNKQAEMQSLTSIIQAMGGNSRILEMPAFRKMLDMSGYSEADFQMAQTGDEQPIDFTEQKAPQQITQ